MARESYGLRLVKGLKEDWLQWNNTAYSSVVETKQEAHSCEFCHGITTNDYRGNCAACGAPRRCPVVPEQRVVPR